MNANEIIEMKAQIKNMQAIVDEVTNTTAGEMLKRMSDTHEAYTATDLSNMTEGILTPSQATAAVRAIERLKFGRARDGRPSGTKYTTARNFTQFDIQRDVRTIPTYSIACNEFGQPLENAPIKKKDKDRRTYRLVEPAEVQQNW